jgi:thiamine-phosphate pyrophosphorylase
MKKINGFYFITDASLSRQGNISDCNNALSAGVGVVQYRDKQISAKQMYLEALKLRRICKDITFLLNDRVDIALGVAADGVHLGQDDLPYTFARRLLGKNKIIGLTVHTFLEAKYAQRLGADYISVGPIFTTSTKKAALAPVGVELIEKIKRRVSIPIVAIGGINLSNAEEVVQAGADSLCAISAVVNKPDVKADIGKFQELFAQRKNT